MIDIYRNSCFGCTACEYICPVKAIAMKKDSLGFMYPEINKDICIQCNLCESKCPVGNYEKLLNKASETVVYLRHNDIQEVKTSRSGAAFAAFSEIVLEEGGVVFGAAFDENFSVHHISATNKIDCLKFKGSKYVQSDMTGAIQKVEELLKQDYIVLFSGTPCQNAGLKSAISAQYQKNLYLIDIVCHGVPSPQLFQDYRLYVEKREKGKITSFNFRDKSIHGWSDHRESMKIDNVKSLVSELYTKLFYTNAFFRESCYKCPFAKLSRVGDITLADFWGWEKIDKKLNEDDLGLSLVMVNTEKGQSLFEKSSKRIKYGYVDIKLCMQRNFKMPTPEPILRKEYVHYYKKNGFEKLIDYLYNPSIVQKLEKRIKLILLKWKKQ